MALKVTCQKAIASGQEFAVTIANEAITPVEAALSVSVDDKNVSFHWRQSGDPAETTNDSTVPLVVGPSGATVLISAWGTAPAGSVVKVCMATAPRDGDQGRVA